MGFLNKYLHDYREKMIFNQFYSYEYRMNICPMQQIFLRSNFGILLIRHDARIAIGGRRWRCGSLFYDAENRDIFDTASTSGGRRLSCAY